MSCNLDDKLFIDEALKKEISKGNPRLEIEGLEFVDTREVLTYMASKMYKENSKRKTKEDQAYTAANLMEDTLKEVKAQISSNEGEAEFTRDLDPEYAESIDFLNLKLKAITDNITALTNLSITHLKNIEGVSVTDESAVNFDEEGNIVDDSALAPESADPSITDMERTTFDDNFSLQRNSKEKAGGRIKSFLSFIKKSRFNKDKQVVQQKTFFGTEDFVAYGVVFDELHRLLAGTYPDYNYILKKLKDRYAIAKKEKNHNLAWMEDLIHKLELPETDPEGLSEGDKFEFVRNMTKHKAEMEFVYQSFRENKDGSKESSLKVLTDNASTAHFRLKSEWKNGHLKSNVVTKGKFYNLSKINSNLEDIKAALDAIDAEKLDKTNVKPGPKDGETRLQLSILIKRLFSDIGIEISEEFADSLMVGEVKVPDATSLTRLFSKLQKEYESMRDSAGLTNVIESSFINTFARKYATFLPDEFSNVFRVAGKLIYTYTANTHLSNKVRDLKANKNGILTKLNNTLFSKRSLYLRQLLNGDKEFSEWFGVRYVSLRPAMTKNEAGAIEDSKDMSKLSDADYENVALGFALRDQSTSIAVEISEGKAVNASKGSFISPTFSDKGRGMLLNGYMFNLQNPVLDGQKNPKGNPLVMALELMYQHMVVPEMERIAKSVDTEYASSLDLTTYKGDMFYVATYLNTMYVQTVNGKMEITPDSGGGKNQTLIDVLKESRGNQEIFDSLKNSIITTVYEDLHTRAAERVELWQELGIIEIDKKTEALKFKHTPGNDKDADPFDTAMNLVFSEDFNSTNFFQMISGDPAQYYKGPPGEFDPSSGQDITEFYAERLSGTNGNITKRLANEIAPGDEADYSDKPKHVQIYLKDPQDTSKVIGEIVEVLDGIPKDRFIKDYNRYLELKRREDDSLDEKEKDEKLELQTWLRSLNSAAYMVIDGKKGGKGITSTDGQEYTTWRTHLDEMLRYGEITRKEHDAMVEAIVSNKGLNEAMLKKAMNPRKPVYANTELRQVGQGNEFFYRKTYIKSSTFPLFPQLVAGTQLEKIAIAMEKLEGTGKNRLNVRAAYESAVKVGMPDRGATAFDAEGNALDNLDFSKNFEMLDSSGFRIQQAVPYKEDKSDTGKGTQESKLLFANMLNIKFTDTDGKVKTGKELRDEYHEAYHAVYKVKLQTLKDSILTRDKAGNLVLDYKKLSRMLLRELDSRKEFSIPLRDGLRIDKKTGRFAIPLWESAYVDNYMALLNSLVKKNVLTHKFKGMSNVLGSEVGFKSWENSSNKDKAGIVYSDKFDKERGLLPQRLDEKTGKILPAQILAPFRFFDNKGNRLKVEDFIDKETGLLDLNRLPEEVREGFSFRIPTQLQQSMAFVEIVGFLPEKAGDLVIAPKEFVIQMGSDFDVDKLYSYMYATTYNEETGVFSRVPFMSEKTYLDKVKDINAKMEALELSDDKDLQNDLKEYIHTAVKEKKREIQKDKDLSKESKGRKIKELYQQEWANKKEYLEAIKKAKNIDQAIAEYEGYAEEFKTLKENFVRGQQNRILDIHKTVMLNKEAQKRIVKPLGAGTFEKIGNWIDGIRNKNTRLSSVVTSKYNRKKLVDGSSGQDGISIFSSDSVLNALAQAAGKYNAEGVFEPALTAMQTTWIDTGDDLVPLRVPFGTRIELKQGYPYGKPVEGIKFGETYSKSEGKLGLVNSLRKIGGDLENPSDFIVYMQNISVDNANMEVMAKVNMNEVTAGAYSFLSMSGFGPEITAMFMSQPILFDYVRMLSNKSGAFAEYSPNMRGEIVKALYAKYGIEQLPDGAWNELLEGKELKFAENVYNPLVHDVYADFEGQDAELVMRKLIQTAEGEQDTEFALHQISVLEKFLKISDYSRSLTSIKQQLNLDSKGMNKNFYVTAQRFETLNGLPNSMIQGSKELIGKYKSLGEGKYVLETPTTLAGFDNFYGAKFLLETFGEEFIETDPQFHFKDIVESVGNSISKSGYVSEEQLYSIRRNIVNFIHSKFKNTDTKSIRTLLFKDTREGSLYAGLNALKRTQYGIANKFLSSLAVKIEDGIVVIDYSRVAGDSFDDNDIYIDFVDLLTTSIEIGGVNPSHVAQQLVYYAFMKGGSQGKYLMKHVPVAIYNKIIDKEELFDPKNFVRQYLQNNSTGVLLFKDKDLVKNDNGSVVPKLKTDAKAINVDTGTYGIQLHLYDSTTKSFWPVESYGTSNLSYYDASETGKLEIHKDFAESEMNPGEIAGILTDNIESIKTIQDVFNVIDLDNVPDNLKSMFLTMKEKAATDKEVKVVINTDPDADISVPAEYDLASDTITVNMAAINHAGASDHSALTNIVHEYVHSLTVRKIYDYTKNSQTDPNVKKAIETLKQYMSKEIESFNEAEMMNFRGVSVHSFYSMLIQGIDQVPIEERATVLKDNIKRINAHRGAIANNIVNQHITDAILLAELYTKENKTKEELEDLHNKLTGLQERKDIAESYGKHTYYYALTSLYEFAAVSGSDLNAVAKELKDKTLLDKFLDLISAVLESMGIKSAAAADILKNVYTVADINAVVYNQTQNTKAQEDVIIEDKVYYNGTVYTLHSNGFGFTAGGNKLVASINSVNESQKLFKILKEKYLNANIGPAIKWKYTVPKKSHIEKAVVRDMLYTDIDPIINKLNHEEDDVSLRTIAIALSVLENEIVTQTNDKSREDARKKYDLIRKKVGLDAKTIEGTKETEITLSTKTKSIVKPEKVKDPNKKTLEDYLNVVSNFATDALGDNDASAGLNQEKDINESIDPLHFLSLQNSGEEFLKRCKARSIGVGTKWAPIKGVARYKAEKGLSIPKKPQLSESMSWNKITAKPRREYPYGVMVMAKNGLSSGQGQFTGEKWGLLTELEGPSHSKGGIQLSINNGKVSMAKGDSPFHAEYGMVIPNAKKETSEIEMLENMTNFTENKSQDQKKSARKDRVKKLVKEDITPIKKEKIKSPELLDLDINMNSLVESKDPIKYREKYKNLVKKKESLSKKIKKVWH